MKEINYLKEKGKIGLVAPSFGCTTEPYKTRLEVAIKNLEEMGFTIDKGPNIFLANSHCRSNTPKKCAKEFMDAYLSDSDAIISVGGGEVMCEILPYINFEKLKKAPHKFFMGFSDNTNLTYTLATISEIPTIYGPNACAYAFPLKYDSKDALDLLLNKTNVIEGYPVWNRYPKKDIDPLKESEYKEEKVIRTYPKKDYLVMEGRLLGGCLDCLVNLCGTKFDKTKEYIEKYKDDGVIFFMEPCELNVVSIQRALFQLKQAGWFKYVKGFIIGRPLACYKEKMFGISHYRAIKEHLKSYNVPILMDVDLGHFDPSIPIITGVKAKVEYINKNIKITYEK
jgi:muramoyltetrapeptide carboxypeptidase LdcA involved in peptidoglycan recycling